MMVKERKVHGDGRGHDSVEQAEQIAAQGRLPDALEMLGRLIRSSPERRDFQVAISRVRRDLVFQHRQSGRRPLHPVEQVEGLVLSGAPDKAAELVGQLCASMPLDPGLRRLERWVSSHLHAKGCQDEPEWERGALGDPSNGQKRLEPSPTSLKEVEGGGGEFHKLKPASGSDAEEAEAPDFWKNPRWSRSDGLAQPQSA